MKVDEKIIARLDELVRLGEQVLQTRKTVEVYFTDVVDQEIGQRWASSTRSLLARVFGTDSTHYADFCKHADNLLYVPAKQAMGTLRAAKDDYERGYLFKMRSLIEAEVFDDLLEQAEHLLGQGYYQAAAVVAGCVLEDGLRKACVAKGVALPPKPKLDTMNADLAKAGVYNLLVQKQITALADLRNKAAHGDWTTFTKADVDAMVASVRRLMTETLT